MKLSLTLNQRLQAIDEIGELYSRKETLPKFNDLLNALSLSKSEASDPNLKLQYNVKEKKFTYDVDFAKLLEIDIDPELINEVESLQQYVAK